MQIWITRACDKACFGCTQGSNLAGKPGVMTPDQFEEAVKSLVDYFGVIGIFGGNPCISKHFPEICEILAAHIPRGRRGLWSNNLNGHGELCRRTFNPDVSNLNVHLDRRAAAETRRDWPEATVLGEHQDSRHSPPWVAMQDVIADEAERWRLISKCSINQSWSALVGVFRGELRGWFCEIAGSQSMVHQHEPDYPDTGHKIEPGWWRKPMAAFAGQVRYHCHACGIPMNAKGELAVGGEREQVSRTHADIFNPKTKGRPVQLVGTIDDLRGSVGQATNYLGNASK